VKHKLVLFYFCLISAVYANDGGTLSFARAAELAVSASAELRHSRASLELLEGAWRWGLRAYFPQISFTVSENDRLQRLGADSFVKNYGVSVDQLLFDGGRTRMSRNLERMELNMSSSRIDRSAHEIAEAALAMYRRVLSSRAILEIRTSALVVLEEQRRILEEEVRLGLALPIDLSGADLNLADARLGIYSLRLELEESEKLFAEILGLEVLPVLSERVDVHRAAVLPQVQAAAILAREQNPDLVENRYSITKRQAELKYISYSWIPTLRFVGNFALTGQRYPLTRYNWSVGINIEFSSPWFQNRASAQTGWEPSYSGNLYDRTAAVQNSFTPLPDPASAITKNQARLALALERERYDLALERTGRIAANAVENCSSAERRRVLALDAVELGKERCRIQEVRLGLGHITRLNLMETLIEQTQREIAAIEAATALLEAERELERFLDLKPGELAAFAEANFTERRE
jgi:outer membrane protein TolC